ncbi:MAG: ATP-dependent Clp protease ATP-binding subunit [Saccharofermentans sp.]|nr:ATP-dependent Clp protease ATP-binding subunit [Saccharofermentans sp.]
MSLCTVCKTRQAIVFTSRYENGKRIDEGFCLKCAYESGFAGLTDMFSAAGINGDNIDEMSGRVEDMIGSAQASADPADFFKSLVENEFGFGGNNDDDDEEFDEDSSNVGVADFNAGNDDIDPEESFGKRPGNENKAFRNPIESLMNSFGGNKNKNENLNGPGKGNATNKNSKSSKRRLKFLNEFGTNLTERAAQGKIDRIIGRDVEIDRTIQILNRRTKNNPVLIGEPGVGKTAVAQGLANKIVEGSVPEKIRNMQVWQLDLPAMVAGTQFRGMFENRIKGVINEAIKEENIILVIDELHSIMGAGDSEGSTNAANILKPALARGELRIIGSTTLKEYKKIEKDSALERRFQKVVLDEPSVEDSIEILKGIKDYYEEHHKVTYSDEVLEFAVYASKRYITDRFLPDKAIDLIDEAGSRANLDDVRIVKIAELKEQSEKATKEYADFVEVMESMDQDEKEKNYEKVAELRVKADKLEKEYKQLTTEFEPDPITIDDISKVVEMWTGIPCKSISETETDKLLHLEDRLHERVIGQNDAVKAVASAVKRARSGFNKKNKPASFLFVGPTGVGKTELVKALTEVMFNTEDSLIRIDMSEYMEKHTVSKLIGSPPGYVGHEDSGQLTEQVRRKPYSVVLFDEIEKAHADVFNLLLQLLDEGRLTDSHGIHVNFENTIIIMTSNAGNSSKAPTIGFFSGTEEALESRVDSALKELFRPEFLNRIDETIIFKELTHDELISIAGIMMKEVYASLEAKGIKGAITDSAKNHLADIGYDPKYGARPLRKQIRRCIEDKLSDLYLSGELKDAASVSIDYKNDEFVFDIVRSENAIEKSEKARKPRKTASKKSE